MVHPQWFRTTSRGESVIEVDDLSDGAHTEAATLQPEVPECSGVAPYEADANAAATFQAVETATSLQGEMEVSHPNADVAEPAHKNRFEA